MRSSRPSTTNPFAIASASRNTSHCGASRRGDETRAQRNERDDCSIFHMRRASGWLNRPFWPEDQHTGHDQVDDEELALRPVAHRDRAQQPDHQRAERRAAEAAEPADHDHGERKHDDFDPDPRADRDDGRGQRSAERRQHGAAREGGEVKADVDTHGRADLTVVNHGKQSFPWRVRWSTQDKASPVRPRPRSEPGCTPDTPCRRAGSCRAAHRAPRTSWIRRPRRA